MKYSRNPVTGVMECYTDDGVFVGNVITFGDVAAPKGMAMDGGSGSGNWGHRGRPGKVGGSAKESGGSAFRTGSKESGYSSFAKSEKFKSIMEHAKGQPNRQKFLNEMPQDLQDALEEQYENVLKSRKGGEEEGFVEYAYRMYDMLNSAKPKDEKFDSFYKSLEPGEKDYIDSLLETHDKISDAINDATTMETLKKLTGLIGKKTGWDERIIDRAFENLSDEEKEEMNALLGAIPWDKNDPGYKNIPNEALVPDEFGSEVERYYYALKAKACGVPGIEMPSVPEGLAYYKQHGDIKTYVGSQDGGYVHTEKGNASREKVKEKIRAGKLVGMNYSGIPQDHIDAYKKAIEASVDNMDDRVAMLVEKTIDDARVTWNPTPGTSNYDDGEITVFTMKDGKYRDPEQITRTLWHEYGHFMDDARKSNSGISAKTAPLKSSWETADGATAISSKEQIYTDAAKADIENLLDMAGLSDKYGVSPWIFTSKLRLYRKSDNSVISFTNPDNSDDLYEISKKIARPLMDFIGYSEYENYMKDHGEPQFPKYEDYVETYVTPKRHIKREREKFPGAKQKYYDDTIEYSSKINEWGKSIGEEKYKELRAEQQRLFEEYDRKQKMLGGVTDCLEEAVNGALGLAGVWGGHSVDYYQKKPVPRETAANVFSMRATNEKELISFMEKFMPNIAKVMTQAWRCGT